MYETNIHDIDDLRKRLMQTWFDFEEVSMLARSCVHAGGGVDPFNMCSVMNVYLYDSSEHFMKLSR